MLRSHALDGSVLVTTSTGDFAILPPAVADQVLSDSVPFFSPHYEDLYARGLIQRPGDDGLRRLEAAVLRTRKAFASEGPSLHIFVVTLRCDHSCQYCQVSRAAVNASGFDMGRDDALAGVDRVFESPSHHLTIEFQGGEPVLRFDRVKEIVLAAEDRNAHEGRDLRFTMATTLHHLTSEDLVFCRDHGIHLSTSIDGPREQHTKQRVNPTRDSFERTVIALEHARSVVGQDGVAALPTVTRATLGTPEAIVDTYRALGFRALFLRSLSPYGFAAKTERSLGYSTAEFMAFYEHALTYILKLNQQGEDFVETNAAMLLRHILTPFHSGYMDLRSPAGAGLGTLVYNYDGRAYPTDEARMAAETGDRRFELGSVHQPLDELLTSPGMRYLGPGMIAEVLPGCSQCAFVPYCGADPVHQAVTRGDPAADPLGGDFCEKQMGMFRVLFRHIAAGDPETLRTFASWALNRPRNTVSETVWGELQ